MKKKISHYSVMSVYHSLGELKIAHFKAMSDYDAKRKFKQWFPDGDGYLKFKLYKMIDTSAGKK